MKRTFLQLLCFVGAFVLAVGVTPSFAVHKNYGDLACGSCHTMHNSQGGSTASPDNLGGATGGSIVLLRGNVTSRAQIQNLCLQCHADNGAQASDTFGTDNHPAPKVYFDGKNGAGTDTNLADGLNFSLLGAGGDFSAELTGNSSSGWTLSTAGSNYALGYGHSVGLDDTVLNGKNPPGGDTAFGANSYFTCTSCHDPHGTSASGGIDSNNINAYRNLKGIPSGSGETTAVGLSTYTRSYVGMAGGSTWSGEGTAQNHIWPVYKSTAAFDETDVCTDGGTVNCYGVSAAGNTNATDGMSNWCAQCHDNWHEDIGSNASGDDWKRHPVDNVLVDSTPNSGGGVDIVRLTNYVVSTLKDKSLPLAKSSDASSMIAYRTSGDDGRARVFCLSCHFAHGGPYYDALRWDYLSSVGAGSQSANAVPSNVGCQLCHNR